MEPNTCHCVDLPDGAGYCAHCLDQMDSAYRAWTAADQLQEAHRAPPQPNHRRRPRSPTFDDFTHEHPWVLVLDHPSAAKLAQRFDRALTILERPVDVIPKYRDNGPIDYFVRSQADNAKSYTVTRDTCTCPDGRTGGRAPVGWCKHRFAVWLRISTDRATSQEGRQPDRASEQATHLHANLI